VRERKKYNRMRKDPHSKEKKKNKTSESIRSRSDLVGTLTLEGRCPTPRKKIASITEGPAGLSESKKESEGAV